MTTAIRRRAATGGLRAPQRQMFFTSLDRDDVLARLTTEFGSLLGVHTVAAAVSRYVHKTASSSEVEEQARSDLAQIVSDG
jgi:hypothetical protein